MSGNRTPVHSLGIVAATLFLSLLVTGTALAITRVVDSDGFGSATNCNDPSTLAFVTIGAAITAAAPGDVIKVCPGIYNEQVTVSKPVTIRGDNGAILKPTAMVANTTSLTSGLDIAAAILVKPNTGVLANVVIEGLTIDGAANGFGDCATNPVGIYYRNASGTISKVAVKNFKLGPGLLGCQVGLGILVQGVTPGGAAANVTVQDSSVNEYQKNGITGSGNVTTIKVLRNVVSGFGATSDIAQNGVQISAGAKGQVESNIITNHVYSPCTPTECIAVSTNILVISNGITVTLNTVGKSNVNIYLQGNNNLANNNVVFDSVVFDGIYMFGNTNKAASNSITNSDEAAIFVDTGTNNRVESNKINDAQVGVQNEGTGTVITGNTFVNTTVRIQ